MDLRQSLAAVVLPALLVAGFGCVLSAARGDVLTGVLIAVLLALPMIAAALLPAHLPMAATVGLHLGAILVRIVGGGAVVFLTHLQRPALALACIATLAAVLIAEQSLRWIDLRRSAVRA